MALAISINGVCYWLVSEQITVGRSASCGIVIENNLASRHHCRIRRAGTEIYVVDLGSTNGTYLNGQQVKSKELKLKVGDKLKIGRSEMTVVEVPDDTHRRPALPKLHNNECAAGPTFQGEWQVGSSG